MITDRVSIIIGDRNQHQVLEKTVTIIKERFNGEFTINALTSLDSFSTEEKEYLRNVFSKNITGVDAWEHNFYLDKGTWKYEESWFDYEKDIRHLLMLLNTGKVSIGEVVYTNDNQLIENLWHCLLYTSDAADE